MPMMHNGTTVLQACLSQERDTTRGVVLAHDGRQFITWRVWADFGDHDTVMGLHAESGVYYDDGDEALAGYRMRCGFPAESAPADTRADIERNLLTYRRRMEAGGAAHDPS
jgi:hypothetical protein